MGTSALPDMYARSLRAAGPCILNRFSLALENLQKDLPKMLAQVFSCPYYAKYYVCIVSLYQLPPFLTQ